MPHSPSQEYHARLDARRAARDALTRTDATLAYSRLGTFAGALLVAFLAWRSILGVWWLVVPLVIFLWLVRRHDQVLRARDAAIRGISFYEAGLARLEDRWIGTGQPGDRFSNDAHVYASDLDLFGRGSLFELLSRARTHAGEDRLAAWLTSPADAVEIQARREAVEELTPALDLREQLALAGADVRTAVQTDRLVEWAESPLPPRPVLRVATWALTAAVLIAITLAAITSRWWMVGAVIALQFIASGRLRREISAILTGDTRDPTAPFVADRLAHRARDLGVIADLLRHVERETFACRRLAQLRASLTTDGLSASRAIRRLQMWSEIHSSERSATMLALAMFLFGPAAVPDSQKALMLEIAASLLAVFQLAAPHVALAVDRWRRQHGPHVRAWLETVGQFEALTSLASYRYEHHDDPFAEIVSTGDGRPRAAFEAVDLGHPLLPAASMVPNDVRIAGETQLLVVSGSNMSGKSTLLRTVGINAVLALAGAPVRAASLRLSPLAIGATLRIQDSLQAGRSRFYAEIRRIRMLADLADGPVPLLFLLDELFHGTNSHDRLAGATGVLGSLLDRGAIGLITTHDLALTAIADELSARAVNVHFEDWFEGGDIRFDYRMRPGPVTRSNALALMRAVGLDVPGQPSG